MARSSGEGYELNFENTPVTTVAKVILHDILGVGYTIDPRVQGTVSLASGRPVPKDDVLFVLESTLRTANVVLARDAAGYRLLPAAEAVGSGGIDRVSADSRPEPGYGVTAIPLQFVSVQTVTKLLDSFAMKAGTIRADPVRNLLLIQGSGAERRAAVETVLSFDADWMRGQSVGIYPVRNTTPEPLIAELEKIMDSGEGGLGQGMVKFQPVGRLNAILVVSRKPELLRNAATWINRLDSSDVASTGVKVYRVRYGEARQLARLLNDMFVGGGGAGASLDAPTNQIAPGGGTTSLSSTERLSGGMSAPTTSGVRPQVLAVPDASANPANAASALNAGTQFPGGRTRYRRRLRLGDPAGRAHHPRRGQQCAPDLRQSGELSHHRAHPQSARPAAAPGRDRHDHRRGHAQRQSQLRGPVLPQEPGLRRAGQYRIDRSTARPAPYWRRRFRASIS